MSALPQIIIYRNQKAPAKHSLKTPDRGTDRDGHLICQFAKAMSATSR
jgi:hypothetical protein